REFWRCPAKGKDFSDLCGCFNPKSGITPPYEAWVVLKERKPPRKPPLPGLSPGDGDRGPTAQPDLIPPFPAIDAVIPPKPQSSGQLGDVLTITGHHLEGDSLDVVFTSPRLPAAITLPPEDGGTAEKISVQIPENDPD